SHRTSIKDGLGRHIGSCGPLNRNFPNEESESYYQISCQFKFRHLDDQRRIEKILLDLILEAKRKKRI
ncbi:hypothetical protein AAGP80_10370, partial [Klebsiella pneumoniae]